MKSSHKRSVSIGDTWLLEEGGNKFEIIHALHQGWHQVLACREWMSTSAAAAAAAAAVTAMDEMDETGEDAPQMQVQPPQPQPSQPSRHRSKHIAIKISTESHATAINQMVLEEARVLKALGEAQSSSPNSSPSEVSLPCPKYFDSGEYKGRAFICMELLGPNIAQLLQAKGMLAVEIACAIGARVALNLYKIHTAGWIHACVSPQNILVGRGEDGGFLYLVDFDHAHRMDAQTAPQGLAVPADYLYASVNVHEGGKPKRTDDIWSLLFVLVECVAGKLPWHGLDDAKRICEMKQECLKNPDLFMSCSSAEKQLPESLSALYQCLQTLQFDTSDVSESNSFAYYSIITKLLQGAGKDEPLENGLNEPKSLHHLRLEQIQWPVKIASCLADLSKINGAINEETNGISAESALFKSNYSNQKVNSSDAMLLSRQNQGSAGVLSGLVKTLSACLAPQSLSGLSAKDVSRDIKAKETLEAVLESNNNGEANELENNTNGFLDSESDISGNVAQIAEAYYSEQKARIEAEVKAKDKTQRLNVAQTQLLEYASQQAQDAEEIEKLAMDILKDQASEKGKKLYDLLMQKLVESKAFYSQQLSDMNQEKTFSVANISSEKPAERVEDASEPVKMDITEDSEPSVSSEFLNRARYIPIRLDMKERRLLRLLEAALNVSEYTDKVDVLSYRSKTHRVNQQLRDMCAILCGLVVAQNYKKGKGLIEGKEFKDNASFFQEVFEIGRRHKILNPEKMRTEYGKLMYMLMDSQLSDVQNLLEFKCVKPLYTVYTLLEDKKGLALLEDKLMSVATDEIVSSNRPRYEIQKAIKEKEKARAALAQKYASRLLSKDEILSCLYSIGDNNSYLYYNRDPVEKMIDLLLKHFKPDTYDLTFSLSIVGGVDGARLSHSHHRQYTYVLQSLTLWREVSHDMFKLWYLAEQDLLSSNYTLADTGQGLNRIQRAPHVYKAISKIIAKSQKKLGSWIGSSVVHLGDHNVPNALMFIDKYTQVPRILSPIVLVIEAIPHLAEDPMIKAYFESAFKGVDSLIKTILADFFRHGFDGSGADNFFDAGSCIDGRLTSAWNWCSKIEKKKYYPVFKLAGFNGFDGDFRG